MTSQFVTDIYIQVPEGIKKEDIIGLEEIIEDDNYHISLQPMLWWRYIIPRRLTLRYNKPIYKWLCFILSKGE